MNRPLILLTVLFLCQCKSSQNPPTPTIAELEYEVERNQLCAMLARSNETSYRYLAFDKALAITYKIEPDDKIAQERLQQRLKELMWATPEGTADLKPLWAALTAWPKADFKSVVEALSRTVDDLQDRYRTRYRALVEHGDQFVKRHPADKGKMVSEVCR